MPIINRPGSGGGGGPSPTPSVVKNILDYTYDDTSTTIAAPGAGKFRLTDPDLTQATNTIVIDHITANGVDVSEMLAEPPLIAEGIVIVEGLSTGNALVGRTVTVTVGAGYTAIDLEHVSSSTAFDPAEKITISYFSDGNVTFNPITGNLEVGGVNIGDPADISQQFFKYKFSSGTSVTAIPGKTIRFSNADPKLATSGWITDRIDETDVINIQNTFNLLAPGSMMFVRAKNAVHMALFQIETVTPFTEGSVNGKTFTFKSPGAIDGVQFTNGEEVYVNFFGLGNFIYDTTTKEGSVNGVQVTGQNVVADFASLPDPTDADNDNEVYKVSDPGVWMECDGVLDAWVPLNGSARLYRNSAPIKSTAPVTQASAIETNGSGKVRVTANAHLMTAAQNDFSVYVSGWTGTGVAGRYRITYFSVNKFDFPDLDYAAGLGVPTIALCNGTHRVLAEEIALPALTGKSCVKLVHSSLVSDSGVAKRIIWALMAANGAGPKEFNNRNTGTAGNFCEYNTWGFRNLGVTNSQQGLILLAQAGNPGTSNAAFPVTATIDTSVPTKIQVYHIFGTATPPPDNVPQNYTILDLAIYLEG